MPVPVANDGLSEKIEWYLNGMLLSPAVGIENLWREKIRNEKLASEFQISVT